MLVAQCHCGSFFENVGHLLDGPATQQILEGTYKYPQDLDPATRLLFEEAEATYAPLLPQEVAMYVTPADFQHIWQTVKERILDHCIAAFILGIILQHHFFQISLISMRPNSPFALERDRPLHAGVKVLRFF